MTTPDEEDVLLGETAEMFMKGLTAMLPAGFGVMIIIGTPETRLASASSLSHKFGDGGELSILRAVTERRSQRLAVEQAKGIVAGGGSDARR